MLETPRGSPYFLGMETSLRRDTAMVRLQLAAGAALAAAFFVQVPTAFAACGGQVLTSHNESAVALAQRCGTTVFDLKMANPQLNMNKPLSGVQVDIPQPKQYIPEAIDKGAPPASSVLGPVPHSHVQIRPMNYRRSTDAGSYTIRSGDTLSAIAARNGVPLESLVAANPGIEPRMLQVGDRLTIPVVD